MLFTPLKPMLLEYRTDSFDDDRWIYEPKWDGWLILLHKQGDRVEAYTRQGNCVTDKFPELREVAASIRSETAVLDCEGVCIRDGRPVFDDFAERGALTNELKIARAARKMPATFVAFDVLATDDGDLTGLPLLQRKDRLQSLLDPSNVVVPTMFVVGQGKAPHALTKQRELEGIVAKKADSAYQLDARSGDWLKIKNFKVSDSVIMGYRTEPQFGMIVGLDYGSGLRPVATLEFDFKPEEKIAFRQIAVQIHTKQEGGVQWIEPRLCCRVQYLERTEKGAMRIGSFKGFRFGVAPDQCKWAG